MALLQTVRQRLPYAATQLSRYSNNGRIAQEHSPPLMRKQGSGDCKTDMFGRFALFIPAALTLSVAGFAQDASRVTPRWSEFAATYTTPEANQVRIERRVTVRISPQSLAPRQSMMAELPQQPAPPRMIERKMEDCLSVTNIAGVQTSGSDKLILYLRDRRMVSAQLERSCRARDFYSGFYLEKNDDGRLCVKRDKLQSRSGANCEVERLRQLVAAGD